MDLPVIMATGTPPLQETSQDPSLRLAATLEKPFGLAELLDTVARALSATPRSKPPELAASSLLVALADAADAAKDEGNISTTPSSIASPDTSGPG